MPGIQDLVQLVASNAFIYGGSFILVLSILVFIHEFGHYIVAKWCGVKIDTFSIGFGRELCGFTDKSGTRWKISLIPLGGYVKMFGDTDPASAGKSSTVEDGTATREMTAEERNGAFFAKSVWQRMAIVFAGPGINYLFAIVVLAGLYMFYGQPVTPPQTSGVMAGSPADQAGFEPNDIILKIDDRRVYRFEDVRREVMVKLDTPTQFTVDRDGEIIEITAVPARQQSEDRHGFKSSRGLLGVIGPGNGLDLRHIVMVDGQPVANPDEARAALLARMGTSFIIDLERGESRESLRINPLLEKNTQLSDPESEGYNALVIASGNSEDFIKHSPVDSVVFAARETYFITVSTLEALGQMFTGTRSATELGGIIRIGAIAGDMAQSGVIALITFSALLSINLGLINLFPIPVLDGGHLVMYAAEALRGKPLSDRVQEYAFRLGLAILVGIMVFANLNDIMQLIL